MEIEAAESFPTEIPLFSPVSFSNRMRRCAAAPRRDSAPSTTRRDMPVAPHYNWNLHASLLGAIENGLWVEYFYRDMDVKVFDDVVAEPLSPGDDGRIPLPDSPGHGVPLDKDALEAFRR